MTSKSSRRLRRFLFVLTIIVVIIITYRVARPHKNSKIAEISNEASSSSQIATYSTGENVQVIRIIDGDTIEVSGGRRVRYIGVNTPEIAGPTTQAECFGDEAREENRRLVEAKTVRLVRDVSYTDKYGRLLRYVYVGSQLVNNELVKNGFARVEPVKPDVQFAGEFLASQKFAQEKKLGLWGQCPLGSH